jgi:methyl halide transferase
MPSPLIMRLIDEEFRPPARVLVVGCGRGWEVEALAQRGFDVTGLDIAPAALDLVTIRLGQRPNISLQVGSVLNMPPSMLGAYDIIVEHTCFCAIDPLRWSDYAYSVASILVPRGYFVGAFLSFENVEYAGPPFGTNIETVHSLFVEYFEIRRLGKAPEPFPPLSVSIPPHIFRVSQLEAIFAKHRIGCGF